MSCINTILISAVPCAAKISTRFPSYPFLCHGLLGALSLGVSIIHGRTTHRHPHREGSLIHSRCNLQLTLRIHTFPPSIYFSLFSFPRSNLRRILFRFLSFSPRFSYTHEFFLLARFHSFLPDAKLGASLILLPCIALLCIISIAAGRETGDTYTLPHALVGSSYTYWMYACLHVDALM